MYVGDVEMLGKTTVDKCNPDENADSPVAWVDLICTLEYHHQRADRLSNAQIGRLYVQADKTSEGSETHTRLLRVVGPYLDSPVQEQEDRGLTTMMMMILKCLNRRNWQ